jgi:hypothetical protein
MAANVTDWLESLEALVEKTSKPEGKMVDRHIMKTVLVAMAVVFMLTIDVPRASAAGCVAKTCTEAFSFCMNTAAGRRELQAKIASRTVMHGEIHACKAVSFRAGATNVMV